VVAHLVQGKLDKMATEFHIVSTGNVLLFLPMIQKRKNIKTLGNVIYTRGLRLGLIKKTKIKTVVTCN
jgi:hypothetical protein